MVAVSHLQSCTCPVGISTRKGQEKLCKHVLYVLHNVLTAEYHDKQQNAFLSHELKEIIANAPAIPLRVMKGEPMDGKRKPVEDDCLVCCMEFGNGEDVTWCRAACGNNIHKSCFDRWASTRSGQVACPLCRTELESKHAAKTKMNVVHVEIPGAPGAGGLP